MCQGSRHAEQKSVEQLGQCTGPGTFTLEPLLFKEQIVSQPARGHHARSLSIDISVYEQRKKKYMFILLWFHLIKKYTRYCI